MKYSQGRTIVQQSHYMEAKKETISKHLHSVVTVRKKPTLSSLHYDLRAHDFLKAMDNLITPMKGVGTSRKPKITGM
jgi:hypothetical protein